MELQKKWLRETNEKRVEIKTQFHIHSIVELGFTLGV